MSDDDDIDFDDEACPKCGNPSTLRRECFAGCDDGYINRFEEDPLWYDDEDIPCDECHGTGVMRWCPKCGHDMNHVAVEPSAKGGVS